MFNGMVTNATGRPAPRTEGGTKERGERGTGGRA